ncbi:MAG: metallophosphoesterase [Puniceicoccales bacterium]|jgi:3',5'-cyclic AMP phosphodiesterase CpdA|nr:metallophosphoesterase [Puniceicoccales bacterium]
MHTRRSFLKTVSIVGGGILTAPHVFGFESQQPSGKKIRFGIISDLHHRQWGTREEVERLKVFIDTCIEQNPDFIIQCGDLCRSTGAEPLMKEWNRYLGKKYHVLGNHDMDSSDKPTIMQIWNMEKPYYSFDQGDFHFVVLDRNCIKKEDGAYIDYASGNWGRHPRKAISHCDAEQLRWLADDLAKTKKQTLVFMHQPIFLSDFSDDIGNANEVLDIFDKANHAERKAGRPDKVIATFMGHDHDDRYGERNGVHYFMLNSATYAYSSGAYFYRDPLFAFVTLDPAGKLIIEGRSSSYNDSVPEKISSRFPAKISNRDIKLT